MELPCKLPVGSSYLVPVVSTQQNGANSITSTWKSHPKQVTSHPILSHCFPPPTTLADPN